MKSWCCGHVLATIVLFLVVVDVRAEDRSFANIGFKFGHTFGEEGGFTVGAEISYTTLGEKFGRGILVDYDVCRGSTKLHFGVELMTAGVGVSIGPTFAGRYEAASWGYTATFFGGLFIYPYYSYTYTSKLQYHELGSYFKFSKQTAGPKFSFGG